MTRLQAVVLTLILIVCLVAAFMLGHFNHDTPAAVIVASIGFVTFCFAPIGKRRRRKWGVPG